MLSLVWSVLLSQLFLTIKRTIVFTFTFTIDDSRFTFHVLNASLSPAAVQELRAAPAFLRVQQLRRRVSIQ